MLSISITCTSCVSFVAIVCLFVVCKVSILYVY